MAPLLKLGQQLQKQDHEHNPVSHQHAHARQLSSWKVRVARWLSQKYQTLAVPVSLAQNIELLTHALSGITIISILDKEPKYRTVL